MTLGYIWKPLIYASVFRQEFFQRLSLNSLYTTKIMIDTYSRHYVQSRVYLIIA
jgi:hypothetical protein